MKNIPGGATIWARQTIESDIFYWKPDKWFKIWFFIVTHVNHAGTKLFPKGTNLFTYKMISKATKATKHQIDQFMRWSKKEQMLTTRKTTRGMVISVLNYAKYQDLSQYKNDSSHEIKTKHKRNTNDTINKNDKNDKNDKKKDAPTKKTIQKFLNQNNITSFSAETFFNYYNNLDWKSKNGRPISDWEQKALQWADRDNTHQSDSDSVYAFQILLDKFDRRLQKHLGKEYYHAKVSYKQYDITKLYNEALSITDYDSLPSHVVTASKDSDLIEYLKSEYVS